MLKLIVSTMLVAFCVLLPAQTAGERAQAVFDEMYQEIANRHYNDKFTEKYRALYLKHRPEILTSKDDSELVGRLNAFLRELGDSHLHIHSPLAAPVRQTAKPTPSDKTEIVQIANGISVRAFYHSELRSDGIGYIRFNYFVLDLIRKVREDVLNKFKDTSALIVDLRGNGGGEIISIEWLANWLIPRKIPLTSMIIKNVPLKYTSNPQPECFKGKLAVIIDKESFSAAEIFAAAVQDAKAGKLYGETTGGQTLPSIFVNLPSGFRLQTLTGEASRPAGGRIEKAGVVPDVETPDPIERAAADLLKLIR